MEKQKTAPAIKTKLVTTELLSFALQNISECVSITDEKNTLLYVNDAFLKTYGYTKEELIGKNVSMLRRSEKEETLGLVLEKTIQGKWQGELINKRKNGEEFPIFLSTSPIKYPDGSLKGLIGVAVDISQQKREQEAYHLLVDNSLQGLVIFQKAHVVFANPKALEIIDISFEEISKSDFGTLVRMIHPVDRKGVEENYKKYLSSGQEYNNQVFRIITRKNDLKWVEVYAMQTSFQGMRAVQLAFLDVTEKKSAEFSYRRINEQIKKYNQVYQELLKSDPADLNASLCRVTEAASNTVDVDRVSIWIFNDDKTTLECINLYDRREKKHSSGVMIDASSNPSYFHAVYKSRFISVTDVLTDKRTIELYDYSIQYKILSLLDFRIGYGSDFTGVICFEECSEKRLWAEDEISFASRVVDVVSFLLENNKRNLMEQALRESEKRLKELNITKDTFFSIIAHDLKSPYQSIVGFSELLHKEYENYSSEDKKMFISNIHESAQNTYKLLQNLLDWARVQTGKINFDPEILDLSTLINETLLFLKSQAEAKNLTLLSAVEYLTEVRADENMVKTILRNLISNAINYSCQGGKVTVSVRTLRQKAIPYIEIRVSDKGVGVSPIYIKKLFRIEEKFHTDGTNGEKGTGLGLILAKEFVELNGGKIWVESTEGKGSDFYFTLLAANS
ncbi:MAG: PAS domain S-box protein [Bacteroidetes bacterium]|nr:PAS domain S-box protein [Bacteroidota bacterium]